jgi:hypothetical protein
MEANDLLSLESDVIRVSLHANDLRNFVLGFVGMSRVSFGLVSAVCLADFCGVDMRRMMYV